jgi:nitroreductase
VTERGLFEVVHAQRACRRFTDDPVPDADLRRLLEAAVCAPSAENKQPWVFVVVQDAAVRAAVADVARRLWHGGGRQHVEEDLDPALLAAVDDSVEVGFGGAPVLVVVAGDTTLVPRRMLGASLFPAVQNLLLAATAMGYGSSLTTLATVDVEALREVVGLPEHLSPVAVVPLGRPGKALGPPRRAPIGSKTHLDRYGTPLAT